MTKISINRPERRNAFRLQTVNELIHAFNDARDDCNIGVIIFTGKGAEAFCSGGDQSLRKSDGYSDFDSFGRLNVLDLQVQIRHLPKPVIAMGAGYAVGGGHVLHMANKLHTKTLPFPFTSNEGFEQSIRMPIGPEYNPTASLGALNRPTVVKKAGIIIKPIKFEEVDPHDKSEEQKQNGQKPKAQKHNAAGGKMGKKG